MAKVLVFGSEGSLMQSVIPKLLAAGHEVIGIDNLFRYGERRKSAMEMNYKYFNEDLNVPYVAYDEDLLMELSSADYIIQAAARIFGVGGFNQFEADILSYDVNIQHNLLSYIADGLSVADMGYKMPHVIYISSSMVYETCPTPEGGVGENDVEHYPPPRTAYGLSKYVGERMLKHYNKQYGIPYTIWRPFNIITPHEPADKNDIGVSHVFADFIENIIVQKKNPLPIIGDGEQIRCFTWIEDVASGIADNLGHHNTINQTFNLGNTESTSMKDLARMIYFSAKYEGAISTDAPTLTFETVKEFPNDVRVRIPNCDKAHMLLNWKATKKTSESVSECVKHLLTNQA